MNNPFPNPQLPSPQHPRAPIPDPTRPQSAAVAGDNTLGGLIPTGNQKALWSYYIGLFSAMPLFGLAMGPVAVVMGRQGLRIAHENPAAKGATHAWVGLVCGAFWSLVHWGLLTALVFALLTNR